MFLSPETETAKERMHLTAREAGRLCERAGVSRAVLIHVSPRYTRDMLSELEAEAKALFPSVEMGRAGSIYTVPFPD
jgi:ribonuclease Z